MIMDFLKMGQGIKDKKQRKTIVCQCILESLIAVTQESNAIMIVMQDNEITLGDLLNYVENETDHIIPHLLQILLKIHGGNFATVSGKLEKDISDKMVLSEEEKMKLGSIYESIGVKYFLEQNPIIQQKMNAHLKELLELDSI